MDRYSKNSKDIKWFELPNAMIFHTGNAYDEDPNKVVLIAGEVTDVSLIFMLY